MSDSSEISTVAIAGAGFMGSGIAECVARAGISARLYEPETGQLEGSRKTIESSLARAAERGRLSDDDARAALSRISWHSEVDELAGAEIAIEAITEDERAKVELFGRLDRALGPETIIASNTSSIPIAQLASQTEPPRHGPRPSFLLAGPGQCGWSRS